MPCRHAPYAFTRAVFFFLFLPHSLGRGPAAVGCARRPACRLLQHLWRRRRARLLRRLHRGLPPLLQVCQERRKGQVYRIRLLTVFSPVFSPKQPHSDPPIDPDAADSELWFCRSCAARKVGAPGGWSGGETQKAETRLQLHCTETRHLLYAAPHRTRPSCRRLRALLRRLTCC